MYIYIYMFLCLFAWLYDAALLRDWYIVIVRFQYVFIPIVAFFFTTIHKDLPSDSVH